MGRLARLPEFLSWMMVMRVNGNSNFIVRGNSDHSPPSDKLSQAPIQLARDLSQMSRVMRSTEIY